MAYKKVGWKDYPSTDTPINATNLDHMDAGILENAQTIGDKTKISGIGDGTVVGAIAANKSAIDANAEAIAQNTQSLTQLNEGIGCSYDGIGVIYRSNSDITEGLYVATKDGFLQCIAKTAAKIGNPFIRLEINDSLVFEANGLNKIYTYLWSPLFEVRKGDIIKYTITSDTDDSLKELRMYRHRAR